MHPIRSVIGTLRVRHTGDEAPEATMDHRHPSIPSRGAKRPAVLLAVLGLVVGALALLPAAPVPAATAPRPFVEEVGTLERFPADARAALGAEFVPEWSKVASDPTMFAYRNTSGTAILLSEQRQLWQLYRNGNDTKTGVVVRDLDNLRIEKALVLDVGLKRATGTPVFSGGWAHAVDSAHGRLFLLTATATHIVEVDLRTFAVTKRQVLAGVGQTFNASMVGGLTYDPFEDELVLLYGFPTNSSALNANVLLYRLDVGEPPRDFDPARLYRLRSCTGPITSTDVGDDTYDWEPLATKEFLYVPCQRTGHTVIVVRLARPETNSPTHREDFTAGPAYGETVLADQAGGRIFAVTLYGQEIWAFEAATMSFVGVVATGPAGTDHPTAYGLDPRTGRVFFQSPHFGLGVVEGRFFPLPQARTHPRRVQGQERILSDSATGRLFVLEGWNGTKPEAYRLYRLAPAPVPPATPDPDANTADVDEKDGVTESRFNATGSGYGSRVLWAKGYATVAPAPTVGPQAPTTGIGNAFKDNCGYVDRDVFAGRVARAEYDTGSTAATAIATAVDGNTEQDLNEPRCGLEGRLPKATRWGYTPATCSAGTGYSVRTEAGTTGAAGDRPLGKTTVACPEPGGMLAASAETALTDSGVEAEHSSTTVEVRRLAGNDGVRSTVESVARGVSIDLGEGLVVSIGEIRSKTTSTSNGRPRRKDMSTHDIGISHVTANGTELCAVDAVCDPVELEEALNALAGARAVFRTGHGDNSGRDKALVEGSPRGAQTAVQKSTARQASDRALVGDFTTEVPALEITVFNDNPQRDGWGRARQIYQFAGVASSATYNVVVRPTGLGFGDDPGSELPGDLGVPEGGEGPFAGPAGGLDFFDGNGTTRELLPTARYGGDGGGLAGVVRAVGRGLRLLLTSPRTALLLLTAWALLGSPAVLSRRRRLLAGVRGG